MNVRRLSILFGVVALVSGILVIGFPAQFAFSTNDLIISVVGLAALLQAFRILRDRRTQSELEDVPDPEERRPTPPPGASFEDALDPFQSERRIHFYRDRVVDALRTAAATVLEQYAGKSAADAEEAVEEGTWTDDVRAAGFLGGEEAPRPPVRARIRDMVRGGAAMDRNVRHTIVEIAERAGIDVPADRDIVHHPPERRDSPNEDANEGPDRETNHWGGVGVVAFVAVGVGVLLERPAILLAAVVAIGYAAYARSRVLPPGSVSIDRTVSTADPEAGETVEVSVTVTNDGNGFLPDVRVVDGVPPALQVTDGSARFATALRGGARETFRYEVEARRGAHAFEPSTISIRDLPGTVERETTVRVETELTCIPPLRPLATSVPLRPQATEYVGRVQTPSGGEGIEFYATREYRPTDAMRRIDWNRHARTGELSTVEFREERAATVVIMIDARDPSYVAPDADDPPALDRAVEAAGSMYASLTDDGDRVGIASIAEPPCWIAPGSGTDHQLEVRRSLAMDPSLDPSGPASQPRMIRWRKEFRKRLSPSTQLLFVSPLCDDFASRYAQQFDEYGYPVTVVSPDPTDDTATGHLLAGVARELRVAELRSSEIPVVDWNWDESIDVAVARHAERWGR